jgi:glycosyltransferase involved in cell wall biosynthesis
LQKKDLKIAVNTRLLLHNRLDGIGRFSYETLRIMTETHPEHEFMFIFDRPFHESFIFSQNITPVKVSPQARHPLLYLFWFELSLPYIFAKHKPDIFLSPDGYLTLKTDIPSVAVIHDLNFEKFPMDLPWADRIYYQKMFPLFAKKARRIATVSQYSKEDIIQRYEVEESKIDVVHNGASDNFKPLSEVEKIAVRKQFSDNRNYFFFVGSLHPRKNLVNLFKAFDKFKQADQRGIKLLIAGAKMWWTNDIREAYESMQFKDDVIFTGRVSDIDLSRLMASALALTYVSYFEGFGIPILEAFHCGTPVITSTLTSMPEVAGDAALLVDPFSTDSIVSSMHFIADDAVLRNQLIEKGHKQQELFSWKSTAEKLWNTIERTVS